jgi:DNA-directed RNA polymerase specialized sigma subunit
MLVVEERRSRLLELVRHRGFASLPELAEDLGVSESRVSQLQRRALKHLRLMIEDNEEVAA